MPSVAECLVLDPEELELMTQKDLIQQLVLHRILERPKLKHQLDAAELKKLATAALQTVIDDLKANELTAPFAPPVEEILAKYEEVIV